MNANRREAVLVLDNHTGLGYGIGMAIKTIGLFTLKIEEGLPRVQNPATAWKESIVSFASLGKPSFAFKGDVMKKNCLKCNKIKLINEFHKQISMADGHTTQCKACRKISDGINRQANKEKIALYRQTAKRKEAENKRHRAYRQKYPEKCLAGSLLRSAVRYGKIERKPCCVCGEIKSEGHHDDYSKPLDVSWLCNKHHIEVGNQDGALSRAHSFD